VNPALHHRVESKTHVPRSKQSASIRNDFALERAAPALPMHGALSAVNPSS
jgi:hypothetical protein